MNDKLVKLKMHPLEKNIKNWEITHILPISKPTKKYKHGYLAGDTLFISSYAVLKYVDCTAIETLILDRGLDVNEKIINGKFPYLCNIAGHNVPDAIQCAYKYSYKPRYSPSLHFTTIRYNKFHPDVGTPVSLPLLRIVNCHNYKIPNETIMVSIKESSLQCQTYPAIKYLEICNGTMDDICNLAIYFPNVEILCIKNYNGCISDMHFVNYKNVRHLSLINCKIVDRGYSGLVKFDTISMYNCHGDINEGLYKKLII